MAEYVHTNGTDLGKSVVVDNVRHGPSNYAALASNGDILELAATPSTSDSQILDWGAGSVVGGKWQKWTLRNKTDAELLVEVRGTRDELLKDTDYFALSDVTMSSDMTTYRQDLRDIPASTADSKDVVWPTKP